MASASFYLTVVGTILLAIAFAAHVAHAVLLASGRRVVALAPVAAPAFAGVVSGSFVERELELPDGSERDRSAVGGIAWALAVAAAGALGAALIVRGIVVGRGPWGSLYEFTVAFAFAI